jgi:transposase-like protein
MADLPSAQELFKALAGLCAARWGSWRVDETYIKIKGQWAYLYRAVDKAGRTVDFLLSRRRDMAAAQRFFSRAIRQHGAPRIITLDGYAASHRAVAKLKAAGTLPGRAQVRSCKYLNKRR